MCLWFYFFVLRQFTVFFLSFFKWLPTIRWSSSNSEAKRWQKTGASWEESKSKERVLFVPTTVRQWTVTTLFATGMISDNDTLRGVLTSVFCPTVHLEGSCGGRLFDCRDVNFIVGEAEDKGVPLGVDRAMDKMQKGERCILYLTPKWVGRNIKTILMSNLWPELEPYWFDWTISS